MNKKDKKTDTRLKNAFITKNRILCASREACKMSKTERTLRELSIAIRKRRVQDVEYIVHNRLHSNIMTADDKVTLLLNAINKNAVEPSTREADDNSRVSRADQILECLLEGGMCTFSAEDPISGLLLNAAIEADNHSALERLLAHRANPNAFDSHKNSTALMFAIQKADADSLTLLLRYGAQVKPSRSSAQTTSQRSPLQVASKLGHVDIVRKLLQQDNTLLNNKDELLHPMLIAARENHVPLIDIYRQYVDINTLFKVDNSCSQQSRMSALHMAVKHGNKESVAFIVNYFGGDVNIENTNGSNALHELLSEKLTASGRQTKESLVAITDLLIALGCSSRRLNREGDTPLHLAMKNHHIRAVEVILARDPDAMYVHDRHGRLAEELVASNDSAMNDVFHIQQPSSENDAIYPNLSELNIRGECENERRHNAVAVKSYFPPYNLLQKHQIIVV